MRQPIRLKLKSLEDDMGEPLTDAAPRTGAFCIFVRAIIGPADSEGEEFFDFEVVSPEWLEQRCKNHPIFSGRFYVITARFDPSTVRSFVEKRLMDATGNTYQEAVQRVARWAHWEFEDYVEEQ